MRTDRLDFRHLFTFHRAMGNSNLHQASPVRHERATLRRLYLMIAASVLAAITIYFMPTRAPEPAEALLVWRRSTPVLGLALFASIFLAVVLRRHTRKLITVFVVAAGAAIWVFASWSLYNSVVIVTARQVSIGATLPWLSDKVLPLKDIRVLELGCRSYTRVMGLQVHELTFTGRAGGRGPIHFADAISPTKPVSSAWVEGASKVRAALTQNGVKVRQSDKDISESCLAKRAQGLSPRDQERFRAVMAP